MHETTYQRQVAKKIEDRLPGAMVLWNNPERRQGIPDLLVLYRDRWAALEVKIDEHAETQPNQPYYVDLFNEMSYAAFVYPQNEEKILDELQLALRAGRQTCPS